MLSLLSLVGDFFVANLKKSLLGMSPYTMGLTAQSPWIFNVPGPKFGIHHVMNPDPYRGLFGGQYCRDSPVQVQGRPCQCQQGGVCKAAGQYMEQFEEVKQQGEIERGYGILIPNTYLYKVYSR